MVPAGAITAAAAVIPAGKVDDSIPMTASGLQQKAWRLWRILGVLNAPTSAKAKQVGRLKWNVEVNGALLEPEAADAAMRAITQPLSVREASRRIALSLEVAAEVFYARIADQWNVFSPTKSKLKETLKQADIIVRGWQADPEEPDKPFSPVLAALGTADQIRLMAQMSRNQDRNRLAQRGILLVPKEGQFPDDDPFQPMLQQVMTAPIADEYSPSSVVPPVVTFPGEHIKDWRHLLIESPYDEKLMERIKETISQLAIELDMAPEVLLGNMDSNHWNAWLSSEENYTAHVEPLGVGTGEVFADAMMQAASDTEGTFAGAEIVVTPDPGDMLTKSPSLENVFEAVKLGGVGLEFLRRHLGADEDDAPTDSDIELILKMQGLGPSAAPQLPEAPAQEAPPMPEEMPVPANGNGNGGAIAAAVNDSDEELDRLGRALLTIDMQLLGTLRGEARMAVEQAREKHDTEDVGVQARIEREMGRLGRAWRSDLKEAHAALRDLGIDARGAEWDQAADASVERLEDVMRHYIVANLERPDSEWPTLPTTELRQVLAIAGGSSTATVAAIGGPAPTFQDPQGFAIGVLSLKKLGTENIQLVQWRFRYGAASRTNPFFPHKEVDGQFMTSDGYTKDGWHPDDHKGCLCFSDPVFRKVAQPKSVSEEVQ